MLAPFSVVLVISTPPLVSLVISNHKLEEETNYQVCLPKLVYNYLMVSLLVIIGGWYSLGTITTESASPVKSNAIVPVLLRDEKSNTFDPLFPRNKRSEKDGRGGSNSGTSSQETCMKKMSNSTTG